MNKNLAELTETAENAMTGEENNLRWEGGMGGKGWIDVARLSDRFFLEKAFIPT